MNQCKYTRLGRPPGPSLNRRARPWDPKKLTETDERALRFVAANPGWPRWIIAEHMGMSPSHLSVICCCDLGREYLNHLSGQPPEIHFKFLFGPYRRGEPSPAEKALMEIGWATLELSED